MNRQFQKIRSSRAYAEGRTARATGASASTNPWPAGLTEDKDAWDLGYAVPDSTLDRTVYSGITGLPAPTGTYGIDPKILQMAAGDVGTFPIADWPKEAIKALLDHLGIPYNAGATKTQLLALVPDEHQTQPTQNIPDRSWDFWKIVDWVNNVKGMQVPNGIKNDPDEQQRMDNIMEMVHDIVKLEAGISV